MKSLTAFFVLLPYAFQSNIAITTSRRSRGTQELLIEPRIIGGKEIEEDKYSFLAGLFDRGRRGKLSHRCGGTLIASDVVLSAAHCASDPRPDVIQIGLHDFEDLSNQSFERHEIIDRIVHPWHNDDTNEHDLVLFKITPSSFVPIKLNKDPSLPLDGDILTVMGWGELSDGRSPTVPFEVEVDYVPTPICKKVYSDELYEDMMLCAVGTSGQDNCNGDSGGPLIRKDDTSDEQYTLIGVVAWGETCGDPDYPSVYVRVSYELGWIMKSLCDLTDDVVVKETVCNMEHRYIVKHNAACRNEEGRRGAEGAEYVLVEADDVLDCMELCSYSKWCGAFEYSDGRCELWRENKIFGTSSKRREGFYCFMKD